MRVCNSRQVFYEQLHKRIGLTSTRPAERKMVLKCMYSMHVFFLGLGSRKKTQQPPETVLEARTPRSPQGHPKSTPRDPQSNSRAAQEVPRATRALKRNQVGDSYLISVAQDPPKHAQEAPQKDPKSSPRGSQGVPKIIRKCTQTVPPSSHLSVLILA